MTIKMDAKKRNLTGWPPASCSYERTCRARQTADVNLLLATQCLKDVNSRVSSRLY
jgi:hypothetical protein